MTQAQFSMIWTGGEIAAFVCSKTCTSSIGVKLVHT